MSSDSLQTVEIEALSKTIQSIERESAALVKALRTARRTRQWIVLVVLVLIVVICFLFYGLGNQFRSKENMDLLLEAAEKQLGQRSDLFSNEAQTLASHVGPVLNKAVSAQVKKDMNKYEKALAEQRVILQKNLEKRFGEQVQAHQQKILAQHESILREEFPQFDDKQSHIRMMDNMQIALSPLLQKYYIDELGRQLQVLYDTWDEFPVADPVRKGDPPLEDVLYGQFWELLAIKLSVRPEDDNRSRSTTIRSNADNKEKPADEKNDKSESEKKGKLESEKKSKPEAEKKIKVDSAERR